MVEEERMQLGSTGAMNANWGIQRAN
jgi:hypothetical protein